MTERSVELEHEELNGSAENKGLCFYVLKMPKEDYKENSSKCDCIREGMCWSVEMARLVPFVLIYVNL